MYGKGQGQRLMTELISAEQLYSEYYKKVFGYAYQRLGNRNDAEDLAADVFAKAVEKLDRFDPERGSYSTWIFTITKNMVISRYRKHRDTEDIEKLAITDDRDAPLDIAISKESSAILVDGLKQMAERDRDIIIARYYGERSFKEIGDMLGMTEANTRVAHGRALKKLKILIGDKI